jgi:hypothetical protein
MQANQSQNTKSSGSENLTLKAYEKKVKEDVRLINENLNELFKLFKIEDERTLKVILSPVSNWFLNIFFI